MLQPPHAHDDVRAGGQHEDERQGVAPGYSETDRHPDRDDREDDRSVEERAVPVRPRLQVASALAPEQEQEERDREEERDLQQPAHRRENRLEGEHDDDDRDQRDDPEAARERRDAVPERSHQPVVNARTARAPASSVVPANQRSLLGPSAGA